MNQNRSFSVQKNNQYLYNGKELYDDEISGLSLDWYDYGARFYDPAITTFGTIDPKTEQFPWQSPYCYAGNNPIIFIDENGEGAKEFFIALNKSYSAAVTVGGQAGFKAQVAGKPLVALYGNFGSKDLIGYRDGGMTYIGQEGSATRYGTALGYGFWGTSTDVTVTKTTETEMKTLPGIDMKKPVEVSVEKGTKTTSVSYGPLSVGQIETAEIRTDQSNGQQEVSSSKGTEAGSVGANSMMELKVSAVVGVDVSINLVKFKDALKEWEK